MHPSLVAFAASLAVSLLLFAFAGPAGAEFHDEHSYLLAADTFARGRVTNAAHPLPQFFETFGELSRPTRMSKYPPALGLALAGGQVLGHPAYGAALLTAGACAGVAWMLMGLVPRRWAIVGGLIVALHPTVIGWSRSYWGAGPSMLGGALLVGALVRIARSRAASWRMGAVAGIGLLLLANSRPFEGTIFSVICFIVCGLAVRGAPISRFSAGAVAMIVVFGAGLIWTGYYNWRITGSVLTFPYMLYERQYALAPPLMFLPRSGVEPSYTVPMMGEFYHNWELAHYLQHRSFPEVLSAVGEKLAMLFLKFWWAAPALLITLAPLPVTILRGSGRSARACRIALAIVLAMMLVGLAGLSYFAHYAGAYVGLIALLMVQGIRNVRAWRLGSSHRRGGVWLVRLAGIGFIASAVLAARELGWPSQRGWGAQRELYQSQLESLSEKTVVFVRPLPGHYGHASWVYNGAEIDAAKVVWANDFGAQENRKLLDFYPDRQPLLLQVGPDRTLLERYSK